MGLHILCPTQKDYVTKAEILNKRWEISLPTESKEVYYENFFIWKGEGTRYRILQYNSNNVEDIFVKIPFEKISEDRLCAIIESLSKRNDEIMVMTTYLPNSGSGEYYYYQKEETDHDQLHLFLCKDSTIEQVLYENLLFVFEIFY